MMNPARSKCAFTLMEIMIVVVIIGLPAALALSGMLAAGRKSRKVRFAREIQNDGHAFVQYASLNGRYPADKTPAQMPDGMAEYLKYFPWNEKTVIGGNLDWDYGVFGVVAGVSVKSPTWGNEPMQEVDVMIDDGNLGAGQIRQRSGGYIYILEE